MHTMVLLNNSLYRTPFTRCSSNLWRFLAILFLNLVGSAAVFATTYYVSPGGSDSNNGLSETTAFKTLAYACSQVPSGDHTIQLAPGVYQETTNSYPKSGVKIVGSGKDGANRTTVVAPPDWDYSTEQCNNNRLGYIIIIANSVSGSRMNDIAVSGIEFINDPGNKANGAIFAVNSDRITFSNLAVKQFRLAGIFASGINYLQVFDSYFFNTGYTPPTLDIRRTSACGASEFACLTLRGIKESEIHHNDFETTEKRGYGIRARSQTNVRYHHNNFNITSEFDIEIAHEHEYGVQLYENTFRKAVSIPRAADQPNPNVVTTANPSPYPYTIRIHHNVSYASYAIEGSRNFVEIDHNMFYSTTGPTRRIYTDYGSGCNGPVWIHHNVAESVDLAFIYKETGTLKNLYVDNNTVYFQGNGPFIALYAGSGRTVRTENWYVRNNVIVSPSAATPSKFINLGGVATATVNLVVQRNLYQNVTGMPDSSINASPGFQLTGSKPHPYYYPASEFSAVVDTALVLSSATYPFTDSSFTSYEGSAPDLGALEYTGIRSGRIYELAPENDPDKRLEVKGPANSKSNQVQVDDRNDSDKQRWQVQYVSEGYYALAPQNTKNRYLTLKISKSAPGDTTVQVLAEKSSEVNPDEVFLAYKWKLLDNADGTYSLEPLHVDNYRLNNPKVYGSKSTPGQSGSKVSITPNSNSSSQRWIARWWKSTETSSFTTGISNPEAFVIRAFPNPATDFVTIESAHDLSSAAITLTDMLARSYPVTKSYAQGKLTVSVSNLPAGYYILSVVSNGQRTTRKILVK